MGDVPAGAVHQHDRMGAGRDGRAKLVQHKLHGGRADRGQDQRDPGIALRTDGTEQGSGVVAEIAHATRADAAFEPAPTDAAGLADPGFVQEPDLEPIGLGMGLGHLGDQRREFF